MADDRTAQGIHAADDPDRENDGHQDPLEREHAAAIAAPSAPTAAPSNHVVLLQGSAGKTHGAYRGSVVAHPRVMHILRPRGPKATEKQPQTVQVVWGKRLAETGVGVRGKAAGPKRQTSETSGPAR